MRLFAYLFGMLTLSLQSLMQAGELKSIERREASLLWSAVGLLAFDGDRGFCTASLISPDKILTAANCLYNEKTGEINQFPKPLLKN